MDERDRDYAEALRRQAAAWLGISERTAESAARLEAAEDERFAEWAAAAGLGTPAGLVAGTRALARRARLVSEVTAAQAVAYEAMLRAGGPENAVAYAAYTEATERHVALLPSLDGLEAE
jgi:hypothetical protein